MPTLVVAGDDDPAVPLTNARLLAARIPDARLHVIRGGGHLFLLDEPETRRRRDRRVPRRALVTTSQTARAKS